MTAPTYLSVQALTKYIKRKFDADPYLNDIYVKGEISNLKLHSSGHLYFTLKDAKARILSVMFSSAAKNLRFEPENGLNVLIRGSISVYEASGQYQIYVKDMQPDGIGGLYLAYEQLKERLEKEGLFAPERKRKIPPYPKVIGVITSPTGAAVRDIITTIKRRYPIGAIHLHPALVQGENAAKSIVKAIQKANDQKLADVLIVGRGGGSIEELWAFNEEIVARAIHASDIPVISAVGHETDVTIADFVADLRAPTPTGAAEMAVPHIEDLMERLLNRKTRLIRGISDIYRQEKKRLDYIKKSYIFKNPHLLYQQKMEHIDRLTERLNRETKVLSERAGSELQFLRQRLYRNRPSEQLKREKEVYKRLTIGLQKNLKMIINNKQKDFSQIVSTLQALSPLKIMERGYSVTYTEERTVLKSIEQADKGDSVIVRVSDGTLNCTVQGIERSIDHE
ncbi:exodeoxyribonuclease VII large subunit [Bacillus sp. FJAT-49736]|uniref:exodeoxyribonuclease VII large subunit n=1 Tax=Bacillus sp. FJAT-49736 TaxID=2833582 RepID=UPI001BC8E5FF|nr:exodeoxyribonuclease VII large subunit [Bacillus sp. FJAT-49736]MBS4173417.1 exodeoxyribonuclease VII large subunit [Bacillus sp. FJAT-49736]